MIEQKILQEFIDFVWDYSPRTIFKLGNDVLEKITHLNENNSYSFNIALEFTNSKTGEKASMTFLINGKIATSEECVNFFKRYMREYKLNKLFGSINSPEIGFNENPQYKLLTKTKI